MLLTIDGTKVRVIGSIHLLPSDQASLPQSYLEAVNSSDELIFESDVPNPAFPEIALLHGGVLADLISADLHARASELWSQLGITESMDQFKPWFVALRIGMAIQISAGADLGKGVDRQLALRAQELGKRRFVLEGIEVLNFFDRAPAEEANGFLDFVVSDPQASISRFNLLVRAWKGSDFDLIDEAFAPLVQRFPITHSRLISACNRSWLPSFLKAISERRRALFVVGCGHLRHGPDSLENLLAQRGFSLRSWGEIIMSLIHVTREDARAWWATLAIMRKRGYTRHRTFTLASHSRAPQTVIGDHPILASGSFSKQEVLARL